MIYRRISVVIPAFNEANGLPSCLIALKRQTYPRDMFDIIVVDNNSTDDTKEVAEKFGATVLFEKEQGYVFAVNRGLLEAKGDILVVTDADTRTSVDWLEKLNNVYNDKRVVGVTGSVYPDLKSVRTRVVLGVFYDALLMINFSLGKAHMTGSNMSVRRDAFHEINGLDIRYRISADVDLGLRLQSVGKVRFVPGIRVYSSLRRWKKKPMATLGEYTKAYFLTVWFRKPPGFQLKIVR